MATLLSSLWKDLSTELGKSPIFPLDLTDEPKKNLPVLDVNEVSFTFLIS